MPETADIWNFGFSWQPSPEWDLNIDYWRYSFKNVIISENSQAVVDQFGADPTRVIRSPGGSILMVLINFVNASSVKTEGLDSSRGRLRRQSLPDRGRRVLVATVLDLAAQILVQRARGHHRLTAFIVNDLAINVLMRPLNRQSRPRGSPLKPLTNTVTPTSPLLF